MCSPRFSPLAASALSAAGQTYGSVGASTAAASPTAATTKAHNSYTTAITSNRDAIVYPDDIIRDSYGNIAQPYVPLAEGQQHHQQPSAAQHTDFAGGIGFLTDVNKANNPAQTATTTVGSVQFALPSYASGILSANVPTPQLELQPPPLSSGNYNYATDGVSAANNQIDQHDQPHDAAPTKSNDVAGYGQPPTTLNEVVGPSDTKYPSTVANKPPVITAPHTGTGSYSSGATTPAAGHNYQTVQTSADAASSSAAATTYTHGKFTGSFGGPAGVLGEQRVPGTAVTKPTAAPAVPPVNSGSYSSNPHPQHQQTLHQSALPDVPHIDLNPPPIHYAQPEAHGVAPVSNTQQDYASFPLPGNSAAGSYNPIPSTHQSQPITHGVVPSVNTQHDYASIPLPGSAAAGGSYKPIASTHHSQPIASVQTPVSSITNNGSTQQGTYASGTTQQPLPNQANYNNNNGRPAFTASLADILGEQKKPGYGVTGANTGAAAATATYGGAAPPTAPAAIQHNQASSYSSTTTGGAGKYTGGFGGPPGHLSPYDKQVDVGASAASGGHNQADAHASADTHAYAGPKKRY